MRLGVVILPEFRWGAGGREVWRRAEELGFDHAWTYDHLAWQTLRDEPWFGAVPTLTAAALVTERIRLGTLVASPNFRHPVSFARELIALDDVSEGRFTLGVGAGGTGWDASMLGGEALSQRRRTERFAEFVELLDRLLREPEVSYEGRYYQAVDARTYPGCVQRPRLPLAVAASGRRAMRVAATYGDSWVTIGDIATAERGGPLVAGTRATQMVGEQIRMLEDACRDIGRGPSSIGRIVLAGPLLDEGLSSSEALRATIGGYEDLGVTDFVVHRPRHHGPYAGDVSHFERVVAEVTGA
ncbi:MAG TPA: LLM class flavin-dependent oxidoreductase [Acidimicrobiales bacterium]|nr:LLM class flavin-dependent oxidoreductase [Acidimicrobiales bacterium]